MKTTTNLCTNRRGLILLFIIVVVSTQLIAVRLTKCFAFLGSINNHSFHLICRVSYFIRKIVVFFGIILLLILVQVSLCLYFICTEVSVGGTDKENRADDDTLSAAIWWVACLKCVLWAQRSELVWRTREKLQHEEVNEYWSGESCLNAASKFKTKTVWETKSLEFFLLFGKPKFLLSLKYYASLERWWSYKIYNSFYEVDKTPEYYTYSYFS